MSDTLSQVQNDLEMDTGPTGLGYDYYDIVIVYAKEDQDDVEGRFIPWIRNIQRNNHLNDARIHLYDDGDMPQDDYDCVDHFAQRAMHILLYLTDNFSTDKILPFITQETFWKTRMNAGTDPNLTDKEQSLFQGRHHEHTFKDLIMRVTKQNRYAVRPVHTKKMSERKYKIPTGLSSARGIEFNGKLDSSQTQAPMLRLIEEAINQRKQREKIMKPYEPRDRREMPPRSHNPSQHHTQSVESLKTPSQHRTLSEITPSFTASNLPPTGINSSVQPLDNDTDGDKSLSVDSGTGSFVSSELNGHSNRNDVGEGAIGGSDSDLSMDGLSSIASGGDTNTPTAGALATENNLNVGGGQTAFASVNETRPKFPAERRDELLREGNMGSNALVKNNTFLTRPGAYNMPPSLPVVDNSGQGNNIQSVVVYIVISVSYFQIFNKLFHNNRYSNKPEIGAHPHIYQELVI